MLRLLTKKLYWHDTYKYVHAAKVIAVGCDDQLGHWVQTDGTIFHPQGGGQPSDEGTINGVKVVKLVEERIDEPLTAENYDMGVIRHYLESDPDLAVGDNAEMKISEEKRLEHSALHTAGHILAGVLRTSHKYEGQTGANHFPGQAKVEFKKDGGDVTAENLAQQVAEVISAAKPISEGFRETHPVYRAPGRGTTARCIEIKGLWTEPCSGTHLSDTSEVAAFNIRGAKVQKGKLTVGYNANHTLFAQKQQGESVSKMKEGDVVKSITTPNGKVVSFVVRQGAIAGLITEPDGKVSQIKASDIHINMNDSPDHTIKLGSRDLGWQERALTEVAEISLLFSGSIVITKLNDWSFDQQAKMKV